MIKSRVQKAFDKLNWMEWNLLYIKYSIPYIGLIIYVQSKDLEKFDWQKFV